jgi:aspartate/methionine/tyrosine aminotransferase
MHPLAKELNDTLSGSVVDALMSDLGRRLYFPKGIVAQSAEAKKSATRMNATIGIAIRAGKPMALSSVRDLIPALDLEEIFPYAPTQGLEQFREAWKKEIEAKNPGIIGKPFSLPLVVAGLTAGVSVIADLFFNPGDTLILPDLHWDNYPLIFETRREARIVTFPFFTSDLKGMNVRALGDAINAEKGKGKIALLLNFPNNPTGYSPSEGEAAEIVSLLGEAAKTGTKLLVMTDDAYFGLFYEKETYKQSLFAPLAALHENILAAKIDGSTKEHLTWGFRTGFLTFASKGLSAERYDALTRKLMGAVRTTVSNSSILSQNLILRALKSPTLAKEKADAFEILKQRYEQCRKILSSKKSAVITPLPFNSGYFMSFRMERGSAERLRKALLSDHGVGTIAIDERCLRVAYSSVDVEKLEELYDLIYKAAERVF